MDRFGRPALARQHRDLCLATMGQLDAWGKSESFAIFGEEADGFPPASVRAGKLRRREAVRLADIRYAPERKTRPSCLV
jgi:hypothetical protein